MAPKLRVNACPAIRSNSNSPKNSRDGICRIDGAYPCALSIVEILAVLYRSYLRIGSDDPRSPNRDYLVLSKGHGVMAQYACLHELGWLSDADLQALFRRRHAAQRTIGCACAGHRGFIRLAGARPFGRRRVGTGGQAAAARRQRVFAIIGDGEANEGAIWEAMMFASHDKLDNLVVIIDANGLQAMGRTAEVMNMGSLAEKLAAFGFESREVDGHDEAALRRSARRIADERRSAAERQSSPER